MKTQESKIIHIVRIDPTEDRRKEIRLTWALHWLLNVSTEASEDKPNEDMRQEIERRIVLRNTPHTIRTYADAQH